MSEDRQLPDAPEEPFRLDVATRDALKEADFDPRILEAVETLGDVGIKFARNATPGYVRAKLFQRSEGLRERQQFWVDLSKETVKERKELQRKAKAIANDPDKIEEHKKLMADIKGLTRDLLGYDLTQTRLNKEANENDATILSLDAKIKQPNSDGCGSRSWDPDAPSVNVQVNVAGPASVSTQEK